MRLRRRGVPTLYLLAGLLAASAVLRLSEGAGRAWASGSERPVAPADCAAPVDASALLTALNERESRIAAREAELATRAETIAKARSEIAQRLSELEAAEAALAATLAQADTAAADDVGKLVAVYEAMKPKDAAQLFGEMAPDFAAGFLARMRADAAAAILAGLDPKDAYTISVELAGRNAAAPQD